LFLVHFPSAVIPIATLPFAALLAFIPMYYLGIGANIMSLGGIAIAIGAMVDASIVVVENVYKRIAEPHEQGQGSHDAGILEAIKEVGRPSFYSLLVIAVAFTPIFALEAYEGRMFKPLAYTKNLAMLFSACLAITLDPALRMLLTRESALRLSLPGFLGSPRASSWGPTTPSTAIPSPGGCLPSTSL